MEPVQVDGIEELKGLIGRELGPTDWVEVTQEDIDRFADVSRDHQWIHVDPDRASKESPYGTTVAHGNLTLSLLDFFRPQLIQNRGVKMGINYGFNKVRFPAAVPAGSRVRARAELVSVEELGEGWWHVVTRYTVEGEQSEKPVCVAEGVGRALIG
jgi:acyl dehydratase